MSAPKMPEIRQALERARGMAGREDTEQFALEAPGLLARLVEILDLYVGHEPTLAEETAYATAEIERRDTAITEALRLLESAPEAFLGASQNIVAAAHVLREASGDAAGQDTREGESTRARVLAHRWADDEQAHLTIRLEFGPEYTDQGIEEITARVRSAARYGFREAEDSTRLGKDTGDGTQPPAGESTQPAPNFFERGWIYVRQYHGEYVLFWVSHVATGPGTTSPTAFGWRKVPGEDWEPSDSDDMDGWTKVVEGGASRA